MFDDDDELFLRYSWSTKNVYVLFPAGPLSEFFAIANLRHASSRIWTCAESEFRFCWMKLCRSDNRNITAPQVSGPKLHSPMEWEKTSDKWKLLLKTRVCLQLVAFDETIIHTGFKTTLEMPFDNFVIDNSSKIYL